MRKYVITFCSRLRQQKIVNADNMTIDTEANIVVFSNDVVGMFTTNEEQIAMIRMTGVLSITSEEVE